MEDSRAEENYERALGTGRLPLLLFRVQEQDCKVYSRDVFVATAG